MPQKKYTHIGGVPILEYNREYLRKFHAKRRAYFVMELGGKCAVCGTTDSLEFDHIDPTQKLFTLNMSVSWDKLVAEVAKCQLLCTDCHKVKTFGNRGAEHGLQTMARIKKCPCDKCQGYRDLDNQRRKSGYVPKPPRERKWAEHGTRSRYRQGCKCSECRAANANHSRQQAQKRREAAE